MRQFGSKGLLLLSALALVWHGGLSAQANGGGSKDTGSIEEKGTDNVGGESDATGSIGGTPLAPEGTGGGTSPDVTQPPAAIPADGSRPGNPCPPSYLLSEDGHMCARP